jgi:hypothetical protein
MLASPQVPGAGIEPAASTFRAWRHDQPQLPRSVPRLLVRTKQVQPRFGKEDSNLHRLIQSQAACRLADSRECPAGVEPARSPWQGERLPLHPGHCDRRRFVKETQSTGWGSNPRHRLTRAVSCLLDHQCMPRVGPEGLEPSPAWLRARCAAANTLVPTIANSRPGRSRTSIFRLSAERSAAELQAVTD